MLSSPFKSQALGPSEPSSRWTNSASESVQCPNVTYTHSPGAAGLCICRFSRRWDGSYWWMHRDLWILPSWARRPGTPEEAWTRPAVAGSSCRGDPLLSWTGLVPAAKQTARMPGCSVARLWLFLRRNPVDFAEGLGGSRSSSTREEAAYTHRARTSTHKHAVAPSHTHTHIRAQGGECSKAVSTSAQKTRHRSSPDKTRAFMRCLRSHRLFGRIKGACRWSDAIHEREDG